MPSDRLDCDPDDDPRCRSNPCAGPTEIYGYDEATCTPCLSNSVAALSNRVCNCVEGYVEVSRDQWGRATCEPAASPGSSAPQMQNVSVSAGAFYSASQEQGFGHAIVSVPQGNICKVGVGSGTITVEYIPPVTSAVMPAPYEVEDYSCLIRLFGSQLRNGWTFVRVDPVSSQFCNANDRYDIDIVKRHANSADTVVDVRLTAWGGPFCAAEITSVTLNGPAGESWQDAF